jgi:hypothetical protein
MYLLMHEFFEKFEKLTTRDERIALLRANCTPIFKDFLRGAFDPNIIFDVKILEYRPAIEPAGLNFSTLINEMDRAYLFVKGHPRVPAGLTSTKKEAILKSMLEAIHKDEAIFLIRMIKKDLKIKFLTPKLVNEAFPDINIESSIKRREKEVKL